MKKSIAIVAGGDLSQSFLPQIRKSTLIIGVDHGAYWLLSHAVTPHIALGDFDSVQKNELSVIEKSVRSVMKYSPVKDCTDMELALDCALDYSPHTIDIYGGIGTRLDHSLGNVFLLEKIHSTQCHTVLHTTTSEVTVIFDSFVVKKSTFKYVSVLSLSQSSVVSLSGFLYPLKNKKLYRGQTIGVSNELNKNAGTIVVSSGKVLLIQSND